MVKRKDLVFGDIDNTKPHFCSKCKKMVFFDERKNTGIIEHLKKHKYSSLQDYISDFNNALLHTAVIDDKPISPDELLDSTDDTSKLRTTDQITEDHQKAIDESREEFKNIDKSIEKLFDGIPDSPIKQNLTFLLKELRKWRLDYVKKSKAGTRDYNLFEGIQSLQEKIITALEKLTKFHERNREEADVIRLHRKTMLDAEKYIRDNIGEFSFASVCEKCGNRTIVNTMGLPHFALMSDNKTVYIWSNELYNLYSLGVISLAQFAYVLQTSPINIVETAKARKKKIHLKDFPLTVTDGEIENATRKLIFEAEKELKVLRGEE